MKVSKKFINGFIIVVIVGLTLILSTNLPIVQDKILNTGLKIITNSAPPFLDEEDSLKVVVCGSRSPLPSPGRAETCILVEAGDDIYIFLI